MEGVHVDIMQELHNVEWILGKFAMAGGMAFKISRAAIHTVLVLASILIAKAQECRASQDFFKAFGSHTGYMEIKTEDEKTLRSFEKRIQGEGVDFARLPNLNPGGGATQYVYDLDKLSCLEAAIRNYEEERLADLSALKSKYGEGERYHRAKEKLQSEMPDVSLITVDDYARTAYTPDGTETHAFAAIKNDAKETEKKDGKTANPDAAALVAMIAAEERDKKIADGTLVPVQAEGITFDTLERDGKRTDVATVPILEGRVTLVVPRDAVQDGSVLIDKNRKYQFIDNDNKKIVEEPGDNVVSMIRTDNAFRKNRFEVPGKEQETKIIPLPEKKKVRNR